jgi:toxin ParE1/3/4
MNKCPVIWTPQAKRDLRDVKRHIARDAPSTAKAFVGRIRQRVCNIGVMPTAGSPVAETARSDIREIYVGSYRVIYRVRKDDVRILVVMHGAQLLSPDRLYRDAD